MVVVLFWTLIYDMLIYYKTWIYQCLFKQVKSLSIWSRAPNLVWIRLLGRTGNQGVTLLEEFPKGYGGIVAYRLVLLPSLSGVHEVFHVSMLWKYTPDPAHVVDWGEITVDTDGTFDEGPMRILDSRDQVLRCKIVRLVKVLLKHRGVEEATWEHEDTILATYHFLFEDEGAWSNIWN